MTNKRQKLHHFVSFCRGTAVSYGAGTAGKVAGGCQLAGRATWRSALVLHVKTALLVARSMTLLRRKLMQRSVSAQQLSVQTENHF